MTPALRLSRIARALCVAALSAVAALAPTLAEPAVAQDDWPGFRGRAGSGVATVNLDAEGLAPRVLWRVEAGIGYSGVTVADGMAITMAEEESGQVMIALDALTGAELWRRRVGEPYPGRDGSWNGPISTPVVRGRVVVALEPWGRLFALDTVAGEPIWSVHLTDDLGAPRPLYGFASSPLVVGDTLVVHGGAEAGTLLGFDVETGESRWSVGVEAVDSQSPVALVLAGRDMVVAAGTDHVFGIDAGSGEVVWTYAHEGDGQRGRGSLVPVGLDDDRVFLAHSNDGSQVIGVRADGDDTVVEQVWTGRNIRNSYTVAVHHEGYLYAYSARILVCIDAATGERQWRSREPGDGFITLAGDKLLIMTKDGTLHVARATPEGYQELASATVFDELTWTPPSFAHGDVFTRSLDEIVRIDLHGGAEAPVVAEASFNVPRSVDPGDGEFGGFVGAVAVADDPESLIDAFFAANPRMPLHEGDELVHFVYRGDDETMAIAGDLIGARQEAPMVRVADTDLFYYSARLLPDSRVAYVFVRPDETITDPRNPLQTRTLIFDEEREFGFSAPPLSMSELRMPRWEMPRHLREPDPAVQIGRLEALTLNTEAFGEQTFQVYVPAGYDDSGERYPVVYYHGQTPRDLSAVPRSLDNLIADGMQPVMAVFSEHLLPPNPAYTAFWADELVPAIDARYRTVASAEGRVGVGGALGTLQALFIAFAHPAMTSGVGLHSVFFLDTDWDQLEPLLRPAVERPLRIYMDWGAYGIQNPQEAWDLRVDSVRRWKRLEELGYSPVGGEAPDGAGWAAWSNRADVMLKAILPPGDDSPLVGPDVRPDVDSRQHDE